MRTNLTAQGLLAGILQEEDDEDQCVMFGSSTVIFQLYLPRSISGTVRFRPYSCPGRA
ncbi:MAG: hypothetical protein V8T36_12350 [Ruthenibacterium lactatiformans]